MNAIVRGRPVVDAKGKWWIDNHEVDNATAEGPLINGDQVAFRCETDVEFKTTVLVVHMKEICLHKLEDGKIVEEQFLYGA